MKKLLLTLFSIGMIGVAQAQMTINELYQDSESLLLSQSVIKVDSMSVEDLQTLVLNWSGMNFRNASKVLVSQTKSQMVLRYSTNSFYTKLLGLSYPIGWYIRMQIEFKQGGVRVSMYDDGNAYVPSSYTPSYSPSVRGTTTPAIPEGSRHFINYFKKNGSPMKMAVEGLQASKSNCLSTMTSLQEYIKQNQQILQTPANSNW